MSSNWNSSLWLLLRRDNYVHFMDLTQDVGCVCLYAVSINGRILGVNEGTVLDILLRQQWAMLALRNNSLPLTTRSKLYTGSKLSRYLA